MTAVDFTAPVLPGDATDSRTSQTSRWWWLAIAAVAVFVPYNASSYQLTLVNTALLASVGALGTQIIAGYAHLISLGHAAFIASAAIISSCVATLWGWPTWIAIPASALGGGLLGLLVGLPALRVRGLYLLISTMALTFIAVFAYSKYEVRYFFGTSAVRVPDLSFFGFTIDTRMRWYWLLLFVCILATMFSLGLLRSRHGRSMLAIRENEMAASSLGVNVARVKLLAFFISSVMIGLMGSLLAFYLGGTSHESLTLDLAISYYVMIVIGGMGANVIGPLIGAFFVTLVPEVISWSSDWLDSVPVFGDSLVANQYPLRTLIYGLIIILVLAVQPGGFVAMGHSIRAWRARTRRGRMSVAIRPEGSLTVSNLSVAYGKSAPVLDDVTLEVRPGEIVALLGANGAGKTTLLRAMSGLLKLHAGRVVAGTIDVNGRSVLGLSSSRIARLGAGQVPEGRRIFATLTVEDNLRVTDRSRRGAGTGSSETLAQIYEMFPVLSERRKGIAGLLSGGEQQMLALGRALMGQPSLLCIDELSLGLAPLTTKKAMDQIVSLNAEHGLSVLLIEQNARLALKHAHRAYVLDVGRIAMAGDAAELLDTPELVRTYLGEAGS